MYEYFEDKKNMYLITEMCKGGELFDKILDKGHFDENYAAHVFKQILHSIQYCHSKEIAHRDIKPENFVFDTDGDDGDLKIIDFGISKLCFSRNTGTIERCNTKIGTCHYISPEVLSGNYDKQCDLWSAGCVLYNCLCGYPPFYGNDDKEILRAVQKGIYDFDDDVWDEISKEAKDLISKLIAMPEKRLTASEALEHKWFKKFKGDSRPKILYKRNVKAFKKFMKGHKL